MEPKAPSLLPDDSSEDERPPLHDNQTMPLNDDDESDDSMFQDTPRALQSMTVSRSRRQPVAIPFDGEADDNDPLISPTVRLNSPFPGGAFNYVNTPTTRDDNSMGRLIPIYSSRDIILIRTESTIVLGSDSSCTVSYLFDSRVSPRHCKIYVKQKKVFVLDLR